MKNRPQKYNRKYYLRHTEQEKARTKKWRADNPDWWKAYYKKNKKKIAGNARKSAYGITHQQYDEMLKKQKGLCLICLRKMKRIDVDHDHVTGAVRGLLCHKCNTLIGFASDSVKLLQRAINYLKQKKDRA